jgi:hypothetical protein
MKEQTQIKTKKFSVKNVLLYTLIITLMAILFIFPLYQFKLNLKPLQDIEPPITHINN